MIIEELHNLEKPENFAKELRQAIEKRYQERAQRLIIACLNYLEIGDTGFLNKSFF